MKSLSKKDAQYTWWVLAPFAFSCLLYGIAWLMVTLLGGSSDLSSDVIDDFSRKNMPYIASFLHVVLFAFAFFRLKKINLWSIKTSDIARLLMVAFTAVVIIIVTLNILMSFGIFLDVNSGDASQLLFIILVTSITAGFGEEMYFRAFLFEQGKGYNKWFVIVSSSLSFAIWHPDWKWFIHTFLVGLLFGWFYSKRKRIFPVILAHILTDMILSTLALLSAG